jgi:hypothetical protein
VYANQVHRAAFYGRREGDFEEIPFAGRPLGNDQFQDIDLDLQHKLSCRFAIQTSSSAPCKRRDSPAKLLK